MYLLCMVRGTQRCVPELYIMDARRLCILICVWPSQIVCDVPGSKGVAIVKLEGVSCLNISRAYGLNCNMYGCCARYLKTVYLLTTEISVSHCF